MLAFLKRWFGTMLPTDANRTSFLVEARLTRGPGDVYESRCAELPDAVGKGATEREAVGMMCGKVAEVIRQCRESKAPIPWVRPERAPKDVDCRRAQVVLRPPPERHLTDELLARNLRTWARSPRKPRLEKKCRRKVAVRLMALGKKEEAAHVLRFGWREWEDYAAMADEVDPGTGQHVCQVESNNLRAAVASHQEKHPHAVLKLWWLRLQMRMTTERALSDPRNRASEEDCKRWDAKQKALVAETVEFFKGMSPAERAAYIEREQGFAAQDQQLQKRAHERRVANREVAEEMIGSPLLAETVMIEQEKAKGGASA